MNRLTVQRNFYSEYIPRKRFLRKLYPGAIVEILGGPFVIPHPNRLADARERVWIIFSEGGVGFIRQWCVDMNVIFKDL